MTAPLPSLSASAGVQAEATPLSPGMIIRKCVARWCPGMWSPVSGALHGYESYDYLYSKKLQTEVSSRADYILCGTMWKLGEAHEVILRGLVHERALEGGAQHTVNTHNIQ